MLRTINGPCPYCQSATHPVLVELHNDHAPDDIYAYSFRCRGEFKDIMECRTANPSLSETDLMARISASSRIPVA